MGSEIGSEAYSMVNERETRLHCQTILSEYEPLSD